MYTILNNVIIIIGAGEICLFYPRISCTCRKQKEIIQWRTSRTLINRK